MRENKIIKFITRIADSGHELTIGVNPDDLGEFLAVYGGAVPRQKDLGPDPIDDLVRLESFIAQATLFLEVEARIVSLTFEGKEVEHHHPDRHEFSIGEMVLVQPDEIGLDADRWKDEDPIIHIENSNGPMSEHKLKEYYAKCISAVGREQGKEKK